MFSESLEEWCYNILKNKKSSNCKFIYWWWVFEGGIYSVRSTILV